MKMGAEATPRMFFYVECTSEDDIEHNYHVMIHLCYKPKEHLGLLHSKVVLPIV
jgi:hypothetical protein